MRVLLGCLLVLACLSLVASVNCPGPTTAGLECIDLANLCNFLDDGTGVLVTGATDADDGCGDVSFPQGLDLFGTMYTSLGVFSNGFVRPSCAGAVDFEIDIAHKDTQYFGGDIDLNPLASGDVHVGVTTGDSTPLGLVTYDGVYEYYSYFFTSSGTTTAQLIMPQVPDFVIVHTVSTTIGRARHSVFDGVEDLQDGSNDFSGDCMAFLIPSSVQAYIDGGGDLDFLDRAVDGGFNSAPFHAKLDLPGSCCMCDGTCMDDQTEADCIAAGGAFDEGATCPVGSCTCGPSVTAPAATTVECDADSSPASTGTATATDNCNSSPTITFSDSVAAGACPHESTITRTWMATSCSLSDSADQIITVDDSTAPSVTAPADVTVECDADSSPASTGTATATDNCDASPVITFSDSVAAGACPDESTITRTWTATDACGNSASADQIITVVDTTAPSVTAPADATVECDGDLSPASTGTATATDNCDSSLVASFTDALSIGRCTGTSTLTRSWVATDACGNISPVDDQTITVNNRGHVASVEVVEGCSASALSDAHLICTLKDIEVRVELPGSDCICELDPVDFETRNAVVTSVKSVGARRAISTAFVVSIEVPCNGFFSVSLSSEVLLEGNFVGDCLLGLVR